MRLPQESSTVCVGIPQEPLLSRPVACLTIWTNGRNGIRQIVEEILGLTNAENEKEGIAGLHGTGSRTAAPWELSYRADSVRYLFTGEQKLRGGHRRGFAGSRPREPLLQKVQPAFCGSLQGYSLSLCCATSSYSVTLWHAARESCSGVRCAL